MPRRRAPRNLERLDQLFRTEDIRATEPIPPRTDKQELVFQSSAGAIDCGSDGRSVRLRVTGDLLRVGPMAEESHRLAIDELHRVGEQVRLPRAHRP